MKTKFVVWVSGFLLVTTACGQQISPPPVEWQRVFGGWEREYLSVVRQTSDGGYVFCAASDSPPGGSKTAPNYSGSDCWVVRLDAQGNRLWDQSYGGLGDESGGCSVQELANGGFLIGTCSTSTNSGNKTSGHFGTRTTEDYWVMLCDSAGNKLWEADFGGNYSDRFRYAAQTPDGGIVLAGGSVSPISGNKTATNYHSGIGSGTSGDYWVVRLDADGNKLWDKSYGGINNDIAWAAQLTSDGGLVIGGGSISEASGNKASTNYGDYDFWLVRLDANGNKLWDHCYGGTADDTMYCLAQTADGGFVMAGRSFSPPSGNKTSPNFGTNGNADFWVVRVNTNGVKLWDKSFGGTETEFAHSLAVTSDGGVIVVGSTYSSISGNKTTPLPGGGADYWVVRLDAGGEKLWEATFGGSQSDIARSVIQTRDGGFLIAGDSYSPANGNKSVPGFGWGDSWLIKLGPERPELRMAGIPTQPGGLPLMLTGIKNLTYAIDWSGDLATWMPLFTNQMTGSLWQILDTGTTNAMRRFYRARSVP